MPAILTTNAAHQGRYADVLLWQQLNLKHYKTSARCKLCGARSFRRTVGGKCFECACSEKRGAKA